MYRKRKPDSTKISYSTEIGIDSILNGYYNEANLRKNAEFLEDSANVQRETEVSKTDTKEVHTMNYFGLFFSFMLPGILIGAMAVSVMRQEIIRRKRREVREERERQRKNARRLYVHSFGTIGDQAA